MTEPQDVLAEALHAVVERWDMCGHGSEPAECEELAAAARGYALVRTPETLDVERLRAALIYGVERQLGPGSAINFDSAIGSAVAEYAIGSAAESLRAAIPSPTPPEGLRAALRAAVTDVLCHYGGHDNEDELHRRIDTLLAASPAPDPGADEIVRLREALLHTVMRRHKFSPACDGCWQARELVRSSLAVPSAEPPETT